MLPYFYSKKFEEQFRKLDKRQQLLIKKKILKIAEQPELGKPLHAPLQNFKSERVEKMRIIYRVSGNRIELAWIDHRGHAYD